MDSRASVEELEELEFEGARRKVKAYMIAIAWTSVEDHVKAVMTKEVTECLALIGLQRST